MAVGLLFGSIFEGQPVVAMVMGIVVACAAGLLLDAIFGRARRRDAPGGRSPSGP